MTHPERDAPQHPSADAAFINAVIRGDEHGVRAGLESGADVNATDATGRSSLACAFTGADWETADASDASFMNPARLAVIQLLVTHPHISLYTLNAPQDELRGVTPLGVAAWLNAAEAVRICLDAGAGLFAIDSPDAHNATALMYASRDGRIELVETLLAHGARPDTRDVTFRSALQYALPHAVALWLCENAVRNVRTREFLSGNPRRLAFPPDALSSVAPSASSASSSQPTPPSHLLSRTSTLSSTSDIVKCVISSDIQALRTLLFPPHINNVNTPDWLYLLNRADKDDWAPVHYCCSVRHPSIEVLDALFLGGADINLLSQTGDCTPLHCLARKRRGTDSLRDTETNAQLYAFVTHLVRDLGVPLAWRNSAGDTCMHVAAEHGDSAEVLRALLDCDVDRTVREIRNSRGLTALDVAKPEFRAVFGVQAESLRPGSSASHLTVTPLRLRHATSTPSIRSDKSASLLPLPTASPVFAPEIFSPIDDELSSTPLTPTLLALRWISNELALCAETNTTDLDHLEARLRDAQDRAQSAFAHFLARIQEVTERLARANTRWTESDTLLDALQQAVEEKLTVTAPPVPEFVGRARSGTTFSGDSQLTAVSLSLLAGECEGEPPSTHCFPALSTPTTDGSWPPSADSTRPSTPYGRLKAHKSMSDLACKEKALPPSPTPSDPDASAPLPAARARAGTLVGVVRPPNQVDKGTLSTKRLKAWLRKKLLPERALPPKPSEEPRPSLSTLCEEREDPPPALRMLGVVQRDLARMDDCVSSADKRLASAARAVARAERLTKKALNRRAAWLRERRLAQHVDVGLHALMAMDWENGTRPSPLRLEIPSVSSVSSASSPVDTTPTTPLAHVPEAEDDTVLLERIVWWKIHERIENAEDEAERIEVWLRTVGDVLHGVQAREGLSVPL
ncbi:hypothetical protein K488DRAFT_83069 [Vararia minispora EC-137]|uniref:Uncharacterized protein n=1 Tax=Vararia minispora EC-137 TaxID=1314806 RepID=A0ACB8QV37_9AGAM|nr:hypothetical protein K488DRAFT_83069 [Vararia minispora EC-137]